jgi:CHASE3 domain sensor protein
MPEPNVQRVEPEAPPSMTALVQGIVNDAQNLIRQELTLARTEIKKDWNDLKEAGAALSVGGALGFLGVLFLGFMVALLLYEAAGLPLWIGFLIVGGLLAIVGGAFLLQGLNKIRKVKLGPEQTIESIKEIL